MFSCENVSSQFVSGFFSEDRLWIVSKESLNLGTIVWISNEVWKLLAHLWLSKLKDSIERSPELFLKWLRRVVVEFDCTDSEGIKHTHGGLESFMSFKMGQLASLCHDVNVYAWLSGHVKELLAGISILL